MEYHTVDPDSIDPRAGLPGDHRYLDDLVDLGGLSVQLVAVQPGESFAPYHAHEESSEVFWVIEGELHVETPAGEHAVGAGEWFAVEPGNPLRPFNPAEAEGVVRALLVNENVDDFQSYDPGRDE